MVTETTTHPRVAKYLAELEQELKKWESEPGVVHVTCVIEVRNGVPREVLAIGGHRKNRAI